MAAVMVLPDEQIAVARRGEMKKMIKWLRKGNIDAQRVSDGNTLLHSAAINEQPDLVRELVRRGATVDLPNDDGSTALMAASETGGLDEVRLLCEHGADANRQTHQGATALMSAAAHGYPEVVSFLLGAGAEVDAQTKSGDTALTAAAMAGADQCARHLLDAGASTERRNAAGQTALQCAQAPGSKASGSMLFLLQRVAPPAPKPPLVEARALAPTELISDAVRSMADDGATDGAPCTPPALEPDEVRIRTSEGELITVPESAVRPHGPRRRTEGADDSRAARRSLYRASGHLARAVRD